MGARGIKALEKELRDQITTLHSILDSMGEGVIVADEKGRLILINMAAEEMDVLQLPGMPSSVLSESNDSDSSSLVMAVQQPLGRAMRGEIVEDEHLQVRASKEPEGRWISVTTRPLRDENGIIGGGVVVCRDITKRKQAEEALAKSEGRYRDLVENSDVLMGTHDLQGHILSANHAVVNMLGIPLEQLLRRRVNDFLAPERRHLFVAYLDAMARNGRDRGLMKVKLPNGEERFLEYDNSLRVEGSGAPVVRCLGRDVTERVRAEEAKLRLAAIVESSDDAIVSLKLDGKIASWNPGAERTYGYTFEEVQGRPVAVLSSPDRAGEVMEVLEKVKRGEHVEQFETVRIRKDGKRIDTSMTVSPIKDSSGKIIAFSSISRDITERKRALVLEERHNASERMLLVLMHEVYNPLTGILGNLSLLKMENTMPPSIGECLKEIEICALKIQSVLIELKKLDLSNPSPLTGIS